MGQSLTDLFDKVIVEEQRIKKVKQVILYLQKRENELSEDESVLGFMKQHPEALEDINERDSLQYLTNNLDALIMHISDLDYGFDVNYQIMRSILITPELENVLENHSEWAKISTDCDELYEAALEVTDVLKNTYEVLQIDRIMS